MARTVSGTLILALEALAALMTGAMYGLSRTSSTSVRQATWLACRLKSNPSALIPLKTQQTPATHLLLHRVDDFLEVFCQDIALGR